MKEYHIEAERQFDDDVERHKKSGQKKVVKKIEGFIEELRQHPTKGTGKPEPLTNKQGQWSRRITDKHRLIYEINNDTVTVIAVSAWGHYGDK